MSLVDTKTSEIKAHATYSASGSDRWMNCPGSIELSKKAPPEIESKYAIEGTTAHACLEFVFKNRKLSIAKIRSEAKKLKYTREMVFFALEAVNLVLKIAGKNEILCEERCDSSWFTCPGQFGTVDFGVVKLFDTIYVIDYKYGAGVMVDPEENSQLIYYALSIAKKYDLNFEHVVLMIIQPRAKDKNGRVRTWETTLEHLIDHWVPKFKEAVVKTRTTKELNCGEWCQFCPAKKICPEIGSDANSKARKVFADIELD